jgi:hypothetical protein
MRILFHTSAWIFFELESYVNSTFLSQENQLLQSDWVDILEMTESCKNIELEPCKRIAVEDGIEFQDLSLD